ncbi:MAG: PAS domain S-box protein [Deltaproteobacteria bacterium]|nr:PAS domain S-box protein [Candidatus Desulfobacula maris]
MTQKPTHEELEQRTKELPAKISESRKSEKASQESWEKYHQIFHNLTIGIGLANKDGKIIHFNDSILRPGNYSKDDILKLEHISNLYYNQDDRIKVLSLLNTQGFVNDMQIQFKRKNGEPYDTLFSLRPITIDGEPCWQAMVQDITKQKQAEQALANAKKQWETTFDTISDWVCIINKDHEIIQSNKACENLINLSADQVIGRHCYEIVHGLDLPILGCPLKKAVNSNLRESMEFQTAYNQWLQITVDPVKTGINKDRFVHIVRDITASKERENEIILLQKAKAFSILSGGIAHDYNNLLTVIWGNISLLKEEMTQPQQQELFNEAETACRQARDLTHQFITLSHVALLKKNLYNVEDILISAIEKAGAAKDVEISMDIKDKIPASELDPEGLSLAFENIICNAFEAMPDGGRLEILVKKQIVTGQKDENDESLIKISFKDSGVGISIHDIDSVFDPYFTTKELSIQKGGGLGLAVSQSIVIKHGGNVRINSTLGKGTTVTVTLPIPDLKPIEPLDQKNSYPLKKPVILLMEDDPSLRKLCVRMLKSFNCEVFSTSHGKAAIEAFFQTTHKNILIDIILLDQDIKGGMGGIETLKKLREFGFKGKAIVVTGSSFSPAIIDFEKYGFDANLLKPYAKDDLKNVIGKFIAL